MAGSYMDGAVARRSSCGSRTVACLATVAALFSGAAATADEIYPDVTVGGLLDLRAARTDRASSWLDHGLGKTRYGGHADASQLRGQVGEAALLITSHFNWASSAHVYLKYDADQHQAVDLVEGFVALRPVSTVAHRFSARAGLFFPPVSFENTGPAWTSPYSITPAAINTWVGEELRTAGIEGTTQWLGETQRISVTGALYKANDPTGSLLAWRGWALHDFKTGLNDRVPLPPTHSIGPGGDFPRQAPWVEPFREIDGRWGAYGALSWESPGAFKTRALYYDNRADPAAFNGSQYAWHTRFASLGGQFALPQDVDLIAQALRGDTFMGMHPDVVHVDFASAFVLLSKRMQRHRVSLRYDWFQVRDLADVEYGERGRAWMVAYAFELSDRQRLMFESLTVRSLRPQRADLELVPLADEHLLQAGYRFFF